MKSSALGAVLAVALCAQSIPAAARIRFGGSHSTSHSSSSHSSTSSHASASTHVATHVDAPHGTTPAHVETAPATSAAPVPATTSRTPTRIGHLASGRSSSQSSPPAHAQPPASAPSQARDVPAARRGAN